ncbi:hypothetical protein CEXT_404191 [Caerostris extrusa]|uniref:Uncharacterized protein n=1 Tax=Caerostris extrusa TaxID=172846 RepID=A0AAV4MHA1_CAEEX|nr:hypothetical protein CEXT_404191 [Caerostris extrusa]
MNGRPGILVPSGFCREKNSSSRNGFDQRETRLAEPLETNIVNDLSFPVKPRLSRMNGRPGISRSFRVLQRKKNSSPRSGFDRRKTRRLVLAAFMARGSQKEKGTKKKIPNTEGGKGPWKKSLSSLTGRPLETNIDNDLSFPVMPQLSRMNGHPVSSPLQDFAEKEKLLVQKWF